MSRTQNYVPNVGSMWAALLMITALLTTGMVAGTAASSVPGHQGNDSQWSTGAFLAPQGASSSFLELQPATPAICKTSGCGKPTYNGKSGETCTKSCGSAGPVCGMTGCSKPTFDGKPGYCSKFCKLNTAKGRGPPGPAPRPKPTPLPDSTKDLRGVHYGKPLQVIGFYYPGSMVAVDRMCNAGIFGNFWKTGVKVTVKHPSEGTMDTFTNTESAFQALKFWRDRATDVPDATGHLRRLTTADGGQAFDVKKALESLSAWKSTESPWTLMWIALWAKFRDDRESKAALLSTGDHWLQERGRVSRRTGLPADDRWSDGGNGSGQNMLGIQLMLLRDVLRGHHRSSHAGYAGSWFEWFTTRGYTLPPKDPVTHSVATVPDPKPHPQVVQLIQAFDAIMTKRNANGW